MVGDGHISDKKRTLGLTTGDLEQSEEFSRLTEDLFGLIPKEKWDDSSKNGRWRLSVSSRDLRDFLVHLGLKTGRCARMKEIPECILRSPKVVMSAFLRAYFDCDGYAGKAGVILSTASEELGKQIQIVLLNYGILSSRKQQEDGCWHVRITGESAIKYREEIGFGLTRKQEKLDQYIDEHKFFCKERWEDEVVEISRGKDTVYDISVEETHRYSAQGFMNHNSFVDYHIMAREGLAALGQDHDSAGIWEYAKHKYKVLGGKWSENPYKLGFEILLDIEDRWNKGKFGPEWENCKDMKKRVEWDREVGKGMEKVFEVRKNYNDFTLIAEFFTPELCEKLEYYQKRRFPDGKIKITDREFKGVKKQLMSQYVNGGLPDIRLTDPNHLNKGWLFLQHYWSGHPLYDPYARETITALWAVWGDICVVATQNTDNEEFVYICDGPDPDDSVHIMTREEYEKEFLK
jgi:stage V sporulation protein R